MLKLVFFADHYLMLLLLYILKVSDMNESDNIYSNINDDL